MRIGLIFLIFLVAGCSWESIPESGVEQTQVEVVEPQNLHFGFNFDDYYVTKGVFHSGQVLSQVLQPMGMSLVNLENLCAQSKNVFDVRDFRPEHNWWVLNERDSSIAPSYFIYEKNAKDYVIFSLRDSLYAYNGSHPTETLTKSVSGNITSSLYQTLENEGASPSLTMELASIYAWSIDFYRIQKNDQFEIIYDQEFIEEEAVSSPKIKAVKFKHNGIWHNAYAFENDGVTSYYDEEGNSLQKAFLKAPVKYSRISSKFSKKRYHPVLKRYKAHLGTDYAAPHGTPIYAVGDGTISKSAYTRNNGHYVKMRHNKVYETQYLHMSKRAVKAGDSVKQGDVIGYVGSTGLATGPHVCFRFWKNGEQVDPLKEELPSGDPVDAVAQTEFFELVQSYEEQFSKMQKEPLAIQP